MTGACPSLRQGLVDADGDDSSVVRHSDAGKPVRAVRSDGVLCASGRCLGSRSQLFEDGWTGTSQVAGSECAVSEDEIGEKRMQEVVRSGDDDQLRS